MAPNVWRDTPPWTRIVPKRYKALLGCRQLQEAGVFYNFKNGSSSITSKSLSENLNNQDTFDDIKNSPFWHFNSHFVLKTTKNSICYDY